MGRLEAPHLAPISHEEYIETNEQQCGSHAQLAARMLQREGPSVNNDRGLVCCHTGWNKRVSQQQEGSSKVLEDSQVLASGDSLLLKHSAHSA